MKIHEYQGKALLNRFGVPVPRGEVAFSVDEAVEAARRLGGSFWVVKSQIHAGGRGKAGGVKRAQSLEEVAAHAKHLLGRSLVTPQTGPHGQTVRRLWIEEGADIQRELYVAVLTDRSTQQLVLMASDAGGMDIEAVAHAQPERIHRLGIPPGSWPDVPTLKALAHDVGLPAHTLDEAAALLSRLVTCYWQTDATLLEINPLILEGDGHLKALDAKFNFDPNALFRHPDIAALRDLDEEDPIEVEASRHDLAYISLDGNIGCLVNGAGLAMATMDTIQLFGGRPANFLDVGGGASIEKVREAFSIMLSNPAVKGVLVNIFGGIMKCDTIAEGIVQASREVNLRLPLVVRMKGTHEVEGQRVLAASGLQVISADTLAEAAQAIVAAVNSRPEGA